MMTSRPSRSSCAQSSARTMCMSYPMRPPSGPVSPAISVPRRCYESLGREHVGGSALGVEDVEDTDRNRACRNDDVRPQIVGQCGERQVADAVRFCRPDVEAGRVAADRHPEMADAVERRAEDVDVGQPMLAGEVALLCVAQSIECDDDFMLAARGPELE